MTHVLLDRNLGAALALGRRLNGWGMTTGQFDPQEDGSCWPGYLDCDLVLAGADAASRLADHPSDPMAPVILLGVSGPLLLARDAWQVLPHEEPDEGQLRMAVQWGLEHAAALRQGPAGSGDREDFLSFLGHEMRSPLTATTTALEMLGVALEELDDGSAEASGRLKMNAIAMRNIRRLHRTVEWSQELMGTSLLAHQVNLQDLTGAELEEELNEHYAMEIDRNARETGVNTDPGALALLLGQAGRVLDYTHPRCRIVLKVEQLADQSGALQLTLTPSRDSVQGRAPRVSRLGLVSPGREAETEATELERLTSYVVSAPLASNLRVGVEAVAEGLRICLPPAVGQLAVDGPDASLRSTA